MLLLWCCYGRHLCFFSDITVPGTELFQDHDSGLNRRLCTKFQVILRTSVVATVGCYYACCRPCFSLLQIAELERILQCAITSSCNFAGP